MKIIQFFTKIFFPKIIWKQSSNNKNIYLTFDDGPTEEVTEWVLNTLQKYNAKGTFFCLGKNIIAFPKVFDKLISLGHTIGNHTFNHSNGWKVKKREYLADIDAFDDLKLEIQEQKPTLFRPPYGKLNLFAYSNITKHRNIVMWSVLSKDYKQNLNCEKQLEKITKATKPGTIIVFHDSKKAFGNLQYLLPRYLEYCSKMGFSFEVL